MVGFEDVWGVNLRCWFPSVIAFRVSLPFDKVLESSGSSVTSVANNAFNFELLFSINQIGRWTREIGSVGGCFLIGGEK
jgi:hypothetical protein